MIQYDLILQQNTHASLVDFTERLIHLQKGDILSGDASHIPTVLLAGANTYILSRDDAETTGLKWIAQTGGHTAGGDTGTTNISFAIDSDGYNLPITAESASKLGIKVAGGATYADLQAKDAIFAKVSVSAAPTAGSDLTNKTYVDGLLAANDAMVYKGTVGTGGTIEKAALEALTTYNAGWTYRVITAGTYFSVVCQVGDILTAIVDRAGSGDVDADWTVMQTNIDGAVIGPASVTDNYPVLFDGTTGKLIKAGTGPLGTAAYVATGTFATSAQGTLADNAIPKGTLTAANQVLIGTAASTPAVLTLTASTFLGMKATGSAAVLSKAEALTILNVADGATANTKATFTELNTGTDDAKFLTALSVASSKYVAGPNATVVADVPVVWDGTTGKLVKSHTSGALGTAAFVATGTFATAAQGTLATNAVPKGTLTGADQILYGTAASTPAALSVGASTIVGKKSTGTIGALTPAEAMGVLCVAAPATKTSAGTFGQIAFDANYGYRCSATNVWTRWPVATNW
jgi:hypothetical protein